MTRHLDIDEIPKYSTLDNVCVLLGPPYILKRLIVFSDNEFHLLSSTIFIVPFACEQM